MLSACQTGEGKIVDGEGVFGLRRAIIIAGAETLVMSLWKVSDQHTQELMDLFYQNLRNSISTNNRSVNEKGSLGRAEALKLAQLTIKERYKDPYYWGHLYVKVMLESCYTNFNLIIK